MIGPRYLRKHTASIRYGYRPPQGVMTLRRPITTPFIGQQGQHNGGLGSIPQWKINQLVNPQGPYVTTGQFDKRFHQLDKKLHGIQIKLNHVSDCQKKLERTAERLDGKIDRMEAQRDTKLESMFARADEKTEHKFERQDKKMDTWVCCIVGALVVQGGLDFWRDGNKGGKVILPYTAEDLFSVR
ncbi:hypothetical protein B9Z19DRAFT_1126327 [Tuber borchii]|uniref:Uncharacterized protein n=1 Tax=Tuber borchii TaxID=42251 RepID=A0A2T6ZT45_TUBBO|nr:hypothetical protein B9Z19DRAFT_1126327 [Tuber borchii]